MLSAVAAEDGIPAWYRGPDDPSGYRIKVCEDLRWMRSRLAKTTQADIAEALSQELGRRIPESSVSRWEAGKKLPGADVYRAYIQLSGSALPRDVGGKDERTLPVQRLQTIEARVARLERERGLGPPDGQIPLDDLMTVGDAAKLIDVSRQTIHNRIRAGKIRSTQGSKRGVLVSRLDVLASQDQANETSGP